MPLKRFLPVIGAALIVVVLALWLTVGQGEHDAYMVAAANPYAGEAGVGILKKGRIAVEAALPAHGHHERARDFAQGLKRSRPKGQGFEPGPKDSLNVGQGLVIHRQGLGQGEWVFALGLQPGQGLLRFLGTAGQTQGIRQLLEAALFRVEGTFGLPQRRGGTAVGFEGFRLQPGLHLHGFFHLLGTGLGPFEFPGQAQILRLEPLQPW